MPKTEGRAPVQLSELGDEGENEFDMRRSTDFLALPARDEQAAVVGCSLLPVWRLPVAKHSRLTGFLKEEFMRVSAKLRGQIASLFFVILSLFCAALPCVAASYKATVLTSDQTGARWQDTNLQNPWGLAHSPTSSFWVADNNSGLSTIYDGTGAPNALVVTIPSALGGTGSPTGIVFNGTTDFKLFSETPAFFLFAGEDGTISGWNAGTGTVAALAVNNSLSANYKGLELANDTMGRPGPSSTPSSPRVAAGWRAPWT
jgi:hypothetical protein